MMPVSPGKSKNPSKAEEILSSEAVQPILGLNAQPPTRQNPTTARG
jgi:hypothetical protein